MKTYLRFGLDCHKMPVATGRRAGVAMASRRCTSCITGAFGDERHSVSESVQALVVLRAKYPVFVFDQK